jgi:response regulator RpfG family c-di-GMP phosphodiesterase
MNKPAPAILLIENDEVTLEIYQRELSKTFTVFAFTEINPALEALANQPIQAVIIEPEISSGQGWGLIPALVESIPDRRIPVIVCSTRDQSNVHKVECITLYLTKPVLPKTLREKVLGVIGT